MLPNDPIILLSYVNTQLRDRNKSLDDFCKEENINKSLLLAKLAEIGYTYDNEKKCFI